MQRLKFDVQVWWPDGKYDRQDAIRMVNDAVQNASGEDPHFLGSLFMDTVTRLMENSAKRAIAQAMCNERPGGSRNPKLAIAKRDRLMNEVKGGFAATATVHEEYDDSESFTMLWEASSLMATVADMRCRIASNDTRWVEDDLKSIEHRIQQIREKLSDTKQKG